MHSPWITRSLGKFLNFRSLSFFDCKIVFNSSYVMSRPWGFCNVPGKWEALDKWWRCIYNLGGRRRELNTEQGLRTLALLPSPSHPVLLMSFQKLSLMLVSDLRVSICNLYLVFLLKPWSHFWYWTYDPPVFIACTTCFMKMNIKMHRKHWKDIAKHSQWLPLIHGVMGD